MFKNALSLTEPRDTKSKGISCNTIPVARNKQFFGRNGILDILDRFLHPSASSSGMSSVAIYGLGGIGKTQIALEYAWSRRELFNAVIWIPAENMLAIEQNLSQTALEVLKLPGAQAGAMQQNVVLFMDWLKFSGASTSRS